MDHQWKKVGWSGQYWVVRWGNMQCCTTLTSFAFVDVIFPSKGLGSPNGPFRWIFRSPSQFIGRPGRAGGLLFYTLSPGNLFDNLIYRPNSAKVLDLRVTQTPWDSLMMQSHCKYVWNLFCDFTSGAQEEDARTVSYRWRIRSHICRRVGEIPTEIFTGNARGWFGSFNITVLT